MICQHELYYVVKVKQTFQLSSFFHCFIICKHTLFNRLQWGHCVLKWFTMDWLYQPSAANTVQSRPRPFHLLLLIIFPLSALFSRFPWSKFEFALIISDQCWPRLLWRPASNAEAAKEKKQLSRPVPVPNMHRANRAKKQNAERGVG